MFQQSTKPPDGPRWYVVKTQPRKEALAQQHLARQAFESFCPKILNVTSRPLRGRGWSAATPAPLFSSYVFVKLDVARDRWRSVNGTIGVSHLVEFGGAPAHMPVGLIEDMQGRAGDSGLLTFSGELNPGDEVRMTGGAFDGWIGKVVRADSKGRVAVLLSLMAREIPSLVSRSQLMRT